MGVRHILRKLRVNRPSAASERCLQPTERIRHLIARRGARSRPVERRQRRRRHILAQPNFPVLKKIIPCSLEKIPCRNFREFFASYWFVTSFRAVVTHVGANPAIFPVFSRDPQLMPPRPHASVPATPNRQASDGAACAPRTSIALLEFGWMIGRSESI